jgi:hypothetical protein
MSSCLQRVPDTGELVIMGVDPIKPFFEVGVVSGVLFIQKTTLKTNIFNKSNAIYHTAILLLSPCVDWKTTIESAFLKKKNYK